jgi:hypothetical protein
VLFASLCEPLLLGWADNVGGEAAIFVFWNFYLVERKFDLKDEEVDTKIGG